VKKWPRSDKIALASISVTLLGVIAAAAVVPEIRALLRMDSPSTSVNRDAKSPLRTTPSTPSAVIADSAKPSRSSSAGYTFVTEDLAARLETCERVVYNGQRTVRCVFNLLNRSSADEAWGIEVDGSFLVDNNGVDHPAIWVGLGRDSHDRAAINVLPPDIPIRAEVMFGDFSSYQDLGISFIRVCAFPRLPPRRRHYVQFRDIGIFWS
jgi:hypothetical protein